MARKARSSRSSGSKGILPPQHGEKGYDPEDDPRNTGFQLGSFGGEWLAKKFGKTKVEEIDAYDFYANKDTGLRPGENKPPESGTYKDLAKFGVNHNTTLPPVAVWKAGRYLSELLGTAFDTESLPWDVKQELKKLPEGKAWTKEQMATIFNMYVVSGEGTPGNYKIRVYELPKEVAAHLDPYHPMMWTEQEKRGTSPAYNGPYSSYGFGSKATETKPKQEPGLPLGVRMRCECGHWFKSDDLPGHAKICPAMEESGEADWALMCAPECGCRTLDEVAKCKPGFPRPPKAKEEVEEEEKPKEPEPHGGLVVPASKQLEESSII